MSRIDVNHVYPGLLYDNDCFCGVYDYEPMVSAFGQRTLVAVDDDEYQADSYRLIADGLRDGERYGLLMFGSGSYSDGDALHKCESVEEVQSLLDRLLDSVLWFPSKEALRQYMEKHEWEGEWLWHHEAFHDFRQQVVEFLDSDHA
jgi:hypothetical protein